MEKDYFEPPLFIKESRKTKIDLSRTPFVCIIDGRPVHVKELPTGFVELDPICCEPTEDVGRCYAVKALPTLRPDPKYGEQTQLKVISEDVEKLIYEPLPATPENAAAFGMTLLGKHQGLRISSPVQALDQIDYEYGMFAGHRSPYQGTGQRLLGTVCTDLEHHNFPHVFASVDLDLPLVISVGRYWPDMNKLFLADLWLPRGKALYVPPRPKLAGQRHIDLHGNRNSALACWKDIEQDSVRTRTLLQTDGGYFHWFWNELPTVHPLLK